MYLRQEIIIILHGAHHDYYLLWRKEAEKAVRGLPFDQKLKDNAGMPELPSVEHIQNCQSCLKYLKEHAETACLQAKELLKKCK